MRSERDSARDDELSLEDAHTRAVFDARTGALIRLAHRALDWALVAADDGGLSFRLSVPRPGRRVAIVDGLQQASPTVERTANALVFRWSSLIDDENQELDIALAARVGIANGYLDFTVDIVNNSDRCVEMVAWPQLHAINPKPGDDILRRFTCGHNLVEGQALPVQVGIYGYWGTMVPENNFCTNKDSYCIMLHAEGDVGGFYLAQHAVPSTELVTWHLEQHPGTLDSYSLLMSEERVAGRMPGVDLAAWRMSYIASGSRRTVSTVAVAPYIGAWYRGADHYRRWRAGWFRDPMRPAWVEDVHSWLQIQIYGAEDRINFRYVDLPAIARECKDAGIAAIQLTGWAEGGQDRGNPSHDIDHALGTWDELRDAIATCQAMGVKIILFSKFTWWDQSRSDYATEAQPYLARDPYGHPYPPCGYTYYTPAQQANINTHRLIPTCSASPAWGHRAAEEMRKMTALGAAGTLYDECQHHFQAAYCFAEDHGHETPAYLFAHDPAFGAHLRETATVDDPEFLLAGELCTDPQMQEYHLAYTRFAADHTPVYRYVAPTVPIMMAVDGFDDRNKINKCLEYRYILSYEPKCFKGRPTDAPKTIAYGRQVDELRRRYRAYLWDSIFRGSQGARVIIDDDPSEAFSLYEGADGRRAVVVCNVDHRCEHQVQVTIEGIDGLRVVRPEEPEPRRVDGAVTIPARGVVAFLSPG